MLKWLLVIGVIAFIYFFFIKKASLKKDKPTKKTPSSKDIQEMIECSRCGVYVELNEAILSNGVYYCSKECLKG